MRFLATIERPPGVDQPEPANQESGCRQAEIVRRRVTHNVLLTQKFAFHGLDGADEARIIDVDDPKIGQQQNAGVKVFGSERRGEGLPLLVPGAHEQRIEDGIGDRIPMRGAIVEPELGSNRRQPVTSGPAHCSRMGVNALPPA